MISTVTHQIARALAGAGHAITLTPWRYGRAVAALEEATGWGYNSEFADLEKAYGHKIPEALAMLNALYAEAQAAAVQYAAEFHKDHTNDEQLDELAHTVHQYVVRSGKWRETVDYHRQSVSASLGYTAKKKAEVQAFQPYETPAGKAAIEARDAYAVKAEAAIAADQAFLERKCSFAESIEDAAARQDFVARIAWLYPEDDSGARSAGCSGRRRHRSAGVSTIMGGDSWNPACTGSGGIVPSAW